MKDFVNSFFEDVEMFVGLFSMKCNILRILLLA